MEIQIKIENMALNQLFRLKDQCIVTLNIGVGFFGKRGAFCG
jgi:hypothetical protein